MAHWAEINENNIVVRVLVGDNSEKDEGESFLKQAFSGEWIKTSINTRAGVYYSQEVDENNERIPAENQNKALRFNYAGLGYTYDRKNDAFVPPKPFDSWLLNTNTFLWDPPVEKPSGLDHVWNEKKRSWDTVLWDEEDEEV